MTTQELDDAALDDLKIDARTSRDQAENGPFYPERGVTRESLIAYADKCDAQIAEFQNGGAHAGVLRRA